MTRCLGCWLHKFLRVANIFMNLLGIAMIIYCLWLQKRWDEGVNELPTIADPPRPWFIYACLGVGIAICLSTLFGYIVANTISSSTLGVYIISISSFLLLQVAAIVTIFFGYNWSKEIAEYIDEGHEYFKTFIVFHLKMCRLIALMILVPQVSVVALAIVILALGSERVTRMRASDIPDFTRSFLVGTGSGILDSSRQICATCESLRLRVGNPQRSLMSYIKSLFTFQFLSRTPDVD